MTTAYYNLNGKIQALESVVGELIISRDRCESEITLLSLDRTLHEQAISLCEICLREQSDSLQYLETLVTALLQEVFFYKISFKFGLKLRSDGVSLKGISPILNISGEDEELDDCADGIRNVLSFALRLLFLMFSTKLEKVVFFDEALLHLSLPRWRYVINFVKQIQEMFDIQIVFITHSNAEFPQQFRVYMDSGISSVVQE